jgi:PadR family transcriptional regulator, regulatory protein PadR
MSFSTYGARARSLLNVTVPSIRMTTATQKVLEALAHAQPDEDMFGLRICQQAGLGSGTVYPVLDRLERAGWIQGEWEAEQPAGRPKRRRYTLTKVGEGAYSRTLAMQQAQAHRWRPALRADAKEAKA